MNKDLDNKYFIILNKDEIIFSCLNDENKISFTKKHTLINDQSNLFKDLENFFINNLIMIEKNLKNFVKKIYIIIDLNNSLSINLSIKYNLQTEIINFEKINDLLNSVKYQFSKYNFDQKVIHMIINKSLIDGKESDLLFNYKTLKNLILEIKFMCLKNQTVLLIKKLFSKYQVSVEKILLADYLREYRHNQNDNLVEVASKIIDGHNDKEILWKNKKTYKIGIFEKFFQFFN